MSKREEKESKTPNGLPIAWHVTGSGKSSALTDIQCYAFYGFRPRSLDI